MKKIVMTSLVLFCLIISCGCDLAFDGKNTGRMPEGLKGLWYNSSLDRVLRFDEDKEVEIDESGYVRSSVKYSDEFITYSGSKRGKVAYTLYSNALYLELEGKSQCFLRLEHNSYLPPEDGLDPNLIGKLIDNWEFFSDGKATFFLTSDSLGTPGKWSTDGGILTTYLFDEKGKVNLYSYAERWYIKFSDGKVMVGQPHYVLI